MVYAIGGQMARGTDDIAGNGQGGHPLLLDQLEEVGQERNGRLVPSGKYVVALRVDGQTFTKQVSVETDPDYPEYHAWEME